MTPTATPLDDSRALRAVLGQFATGVAIVTARDGEGRRAGVTINSFASVSLAPPLVLWSLGAAAASRALFEAARYHAINVLAAPQEPLARRFAMRAADRFAGIALREGPFDTLLLDGALAQLVCLVRERREIGDHTLFLSEVVHHDRTAGEPLIFHASGYRTIGRCAETGVRPHEPADRAVSCLT
jgi:unspecific monooxygenase